jgi:hypothetical protein
LKSNDFILVFLFCLLLVLPEKNIAQINHDQGNINADSLIRPEFTGISVVDSLYLSDTVAVRRDLMLSFRDSNFTAHQIRIYPDSIRSILIDSVIKVTDTVIIGQDTVYTSGEQILLEIHEFSRKKNLVARIVREIFRYEPIRGVSRTQNAVKSEKPFAEFEDKIIKTITVTVISPLGYDIHDTLKKPRSLVERTVNFLHIKSQPWLIRNKLLFRSGDKVDPFIFSETERLLRISNYLYDARIVLSEIKDSDSVDVRVLVQDVVSISAGASVDVKRKAGELKLQDVNFLGLGQSLNYKIFYSPDIPFKSNHYVSYYINNISNTFISPYIYLNHETGKRDLVLGMNRELVTPGLSWIGGVNYQRFRFPFSYISNVQGDTILLNRYDLWAGIPTFIGITENNRKKGKRLIFSSRYLSTDFIKRPVIRDTDSYPYYNHNYLLGSVSVFQRTSFRGSYIFRFGRTEDIPTGKLISFTGGINFSERALRSYFGLSYYRSFYNNRIGYFYYNFSTGTFFNEGKNEESVLQTKVMYFTPLIRIGKLRARTFAGIRFTYGERLIYGNTVNINNDSGIRGFNSGAINGNRKLVINLEQDLFIPFTFVGFKFAVVGFTDFGWISFEKLVDKTSFYKGFGVGVKIRNEHINLDGIQLMFGFYPDGESVGYKNYMFFKRSTSFFNFNDFNFGRPEILPFY